MTPSTPHRRGVRLPLLSKILIWLMLNLLVLGAGFYFLFQAEFKFSLDSLLAGPAGDRVHSVSQAILSALRSSPPEEWDGVLRSFSTAYQVEFILLGPDGVPVAGGPQALPESVLQRVIETPRRGPGFGFGPPPGKGLRRGWGQPDLPPVQPRFTLRTEQPKRYWVGMRVPPMFQEGEPTVPRPGAWTLLLATDSLYSGGLFLDMRPWALAAAGALLISLLLWVPMVRGLTNSISQLTRATNEIANGNFNVRVSETRGDELGQLGSSVNRMADRLDGFVKGQKRFLGDIAHELCSPIARMQVALGILEEAGSPAQAPQMRDVREELEEMSGLINELLSFSKASLDDNNAPLEQVGLASLIREVIRREQPAGTSINVAVREQSCILARSDLLRRAIANLVRNAVRYAGEAGPITISESDSHDEIILTISDLGPGVDEKELQRIFDPFHRAEASRSRDTGGAGLGLAIVKTCVEACGGTVRAANLQPKGFQVVLHLKKCQS